MAARYSVVLVTCPSQKAADKLAQGLLQSRLAACVGVMPGLSSSYWWEGKIEKSSELLLIAKTKADLVPELADFVRRNHPYSVPEVLALPVLHGNPAYLDWIGANTQFTRPKAAWTGGKSR